MRTYVKGRNTRFRSIPDSWVMATTGKPRKNQCKILARMKEDRPGLTELYRVADHLCDA